MMRIERYTQAMAKEILDRKEETKDVSQAVREIITGVRESGDQALLAYCEKFDGAVPSPLEVTPEMIGEALQETGEEYLGLLQRAADNIREYHAKQRRTGFEFTREDGTVLGEKITPLDSVGIYVPGGRAAYPSTVLMNAVPAKIAGCGQVIMVSPLSYQGRIHPRILAAAHVAGVDRIFQIGGAQAVAALAYGTESVPYVDKIVGPGNMYVAEAKRQVFGRVGIDMIAGPSEILIIADGKSDPVNVSADLLSQAEHDPEAAAVLITDSEELAVQVQQELERQVRKLAREEIASASLNSHGRIIIAEDISQAVQIADMIAPEHLELCVDDPFVLLPMIRHAGSVFLGRWCPEAFGDYMAGTNHTLPTGGTARFSGALSVDDFVRRTQYIYTDRNGLQKYAQDIHDFAVSEGLGAHAESAVIRFREEEQ
ncbi:MAG: histidinol dehydrogenase [Solobacterium sp.]|nr:histidinol dehydrogenase [Solobacterium sp.]